MLDGRALAVAGVHRVGGPAVVRFLAGDRADDRQLVGDLGELPEVLVEDDAGQLRLGDAERAAVLQRGVGLRVPRFLVGHAAGQDDLDDALGRRLPCSRSSSGRPGPACVRKSPRVRPRAPTTPTRRNSRRPGLRKWAGIVVPGHDVFGGGGHGASEVSGKRVGHGFEGGKARHARRHQRLILQRWLPAAARWGPTREAVDQPESGGWAQFAAQQPNMNAWKRQQIAANLRRRNPRGDCAVSKAAATCKREDPRMAVKPPGQRGTC